MRAPLADPLDRDQFGDHGVVVELFEAVELERPVDHVLGERAQVGGLGARKASGRAQRVGVGGEDLLRRRRPAIEVPEQS